MFEMIIFFFLNFFLIHSSLESQLIHNGKGFTLILWHEKFVVRAVFRFVSAADYFIDSFRCQSRFLCVCAVLMVAVDNAAFGGG